MENNSELKFDETGTIVTGCNRDATHVKIPYGVKKIEDRAFLNCSRLQTLEIPDSVTTIGDRAFEWCTSLEQIELGNGVKYIECYAFKICESLKSINIPHSVSNIGQGAFCSCKSLSSIKISDNVNSIGDDAFYRCKKLQYIEVSKDNQNYASVDGILYSKDMHTLLAYPEGRKDDNLIIIDSISNIDISRLNFCLNVKNIHVTSKNQHFASVDGVLYTKDLHTLLRYPDNKSEKTFSVPDCVQNIADYAFYGCKTLTSVDIAGNVRKIGAFAFAHCKSLTTIEIPFGITNIEEYTFYQCSSLSSIRLPDSLKIIGDCAFGYCSSLHSIDIPNNVTYFGIWAFCHCSSFQSFSIPHSVIAIKSAFDECFSLRELHIFNEHPESFYIDEYSFNGLENCTLYIPIGTYYAYSEDERFKAFKEITYDV